MAANKEIRDLIQKNRLRHWEVASVLRVSDSTFSKKMRSEFPPTYKIKVIDAINQVIRESRKY